MSSESNARVGEALPDSASKLNLTASRRLLPSGLLESSAEGKLLVFAGSGISLNTFRPTWSQFILGIIEQSGSGGLGLEGHAAALKLVEEIRSPAHARFLAYFAKQQLSKKLSGGEEVYRGIISKAVEPECRGPYSTCHISLLQLKPALIVTTNFDPCFQECPRVNDIEWKADVVNRLADYAALDLVPRTIWHLHGHVSNPKTMVVNTADYYDAYQTNIGCRSFLRRIFSAYDVLFVGTGMTEDEILSEFCQVDRNGLSSWAVCADSNPEKDLFACLGSAVETYAVQGGNHSELQVLLNDWARGAQGSKGVE